MKRVLISILIASMLVMLGGISASAKTITLTYMGWGNVDWATASQAVRTEVFEKEYPNVKVENTIVPLHEYHEKLLTMIAGGKAPDIACIESSSLSQYVYYRAIISLNEYIEKDTTLDWDDYLLHEDVTYDGDIYGLPAGRNFACRVYNEDMFNEAGIPTPYQIQKEGNWDWEEFIRTGKKLTVDIDGDGVPDQYGWTFSGWWGREFFPMVWNEGGKIFDKVKFPTKCLLNSPEAKTALQRIVDTVRKDKICPPPEMEAWKLGIHFGAGRVAMAWWNIQAACWAIYGNWFNFKHNLMLPPRGPKGLHTWAEVVPEVIFSQSKNKELAYELLKSMTSLNAYLRMLEENIDFIPGRKSFVLDPKFKEKFGEILNIDVDLDLIEKYAHVTPKPIDSGRILTIIGNEIDLALRGKKTAGEACEDMTSKVNQVLEETAG